MLLKPNITLVNSIPGVSEGQQQGLEVMEGSNFTISCSIRPQYPGGSFHLTFTGANATHTYIQPAVNHSDTLLSPVANLTGPNTTFNLTEYNGTFTVTESYTTNNPTNSYTTDEYDYYQYEDMQYEEVELKGDAEAAGSDSRTPEYEVDLTDLNESNTTLNLTESNGTFNLTESNGTFNHTESNTTQDDIQPVVNRSDNFLFADFRFPAANHSHQGNYSCTYHLYVFNHNFSSESEVLSLTVKGV